MPSAVLRVDCRKDDQIKSKDYLQIVRDTFSDHSEKKPEEFRPTSTIPK